MHRVDNRTPFICSSAPQQPIDLLLLMLLPQASCVQHPQHVIGRRPFIIRRAASVPNQPPPGPLYHAAFHNSTLSRLVQQKFCVAAALVLLSGVKVHWTRANANKLLSTEEQSDLVSILAHSKLPPLPALMITADQRSSQQTYHHPNHPQTFIP